MKTPIDYDTWTDRYSRMRAIADRIAKSRHARAMGIARRHGMTDGCCIHNASIATVGEGWGAGPQGRERIRAARAATRLLNRQWEGHRVLERWDRRVRGY